MIDKTKAEIREELQKGIKRNDVLPLDWAMHRIEPIIDKWAEELEKELRYEIGKAYFNLEKVEDFTVYRIIEDVFHGGKE